MKKVIFGTYIGVLESSPLKGRGTEIRISRAISAPTS